jgi:predicted transcriptional regulator YheO
MNFSKNLEAYIPLVDFIADIIGPHCEVLLHNIEGVENSVIAIRNGYISGRYIGCPLTDLGLKLLENKCYLRSNAMINYRSQTESGEKLISSTYYVKNECGELIGMLCVNILDSRENYNNHTNIVDGYLNNMFNHTESVSDSDDVQESLSSSLDHVIENEIAKVLSMYNVTSERLSTEEKNQAVQALRQNGILKIKGAITKVANALKTSESTIYRYLSTK